LFNQFQRRMPSSHFKTKMGSPGCKTSELCNPQVRVRETRNALGRPPPLTKPPRNPKVQSPCGDGYLLCVNCDDLCLSSRVFLTCRLDSCRDGLPFILLTPTFTYLTCKEIKSGLVETKRYILCM